MTLRQLSAITAGLTAGLGLAAVASAGGLFIPGAGAVSTARAGASVASADDGEAIAINPAGIAKSKGTTVTIGVAAVDYLMSFTRNGTYDPITEEATTYEGQPYPTVTNAARPPLGIGAFQPIPVIAIVSDLGGRIPNLHAGFGVYAPSSYPFRDMTKVNGRTYTFNSDFDSPPPPTRYDIMTQEAAVILPSVVVAYRVMPELDVGARFSAGTAQLKSTVAVWGVPANYEEWVKADGTFSLDAKDNFVPTYGLGATYRPAPAIELGANFSGPIDIHAQGNAQSVNGPAVSLNGTAIVVTPVSDDAARCARGGTAANLKGCVDVELPMSAQLGGRYKLLGEDGRVRGDLELDLDWEHWGAQCDYVKDPTCLAPSDYRVVVDGQIGTASQPNGLNLKDNLVRHGLQDTYAVRLGGSYNIPVGTDEVIARGGVSYDTAAAKTGWERADLDGAARTMIAAGGSYRTAKFQFDAGVGVILEGTRTDSRTCNPTGDPGSMGCGPGGAENVGATFGDRQGPDPINPILNPDVQAESPVNEGTYKSHYLIFTIGMSTWF
jgi:long-subunit fatty acid transport protein